MNPPIDAERHAVLKAMLSDTELETCDLNLAAWVPVDHDPCPPNVVEWFTPNLNLAAIP